MAAGRFDEDTQEGSRVLSYTPQTPRIGLFDSGVGGITVLDQLRKSFGRSIKYFYLGDTAHVPYGTKSPAQIEKLSVSCAETLKAKEIDLLIVACNTASSWALPAIRSVMGSVPVVGVVEPGVQAALDVYAELERADPLLTDSDRSAEGDQRAILVLATRATVQSHAYGKALLEARIDVPVYEQACPLLVPMIEEGWIDHSILHQTISEYVEPYRRKHSGGVALLGCTHYPWIHEAFQKALPGWTVVNSAQSVVRALEKIQWVQAKIERRMTDSALRVPPDVFPETTPIEWIFTDPEAVPAFVRQWMVQQKCSAEALPQSENLENQESRLFLIS